MAWTTPSTVVAGQTLSAAFWNEQVRDNLTELAPFFGAWTSYTPTFSGGTWAVGNGTFYKTKYLQVGKLVVYTGVFIFGSTTVAASANGLAISLPVNNENDGAQGSCEILDAGTNNYASSAFIGTSTFDPRALTVSGSNIVASGFTATSPFTWATNDQIRWTLIYQAAS